ncbi:unnamed protein product [Brassica rapa subsp. trilocularis]
MLDTWEHLYHQKDTRRLRLSPPRLTAGTTSPHHHFVGAQKPQSLRRNHLCSSNLSTRRRASSLLRDLIRLGQRSTTRETNKNQPNHTRNPNTKNRHEILKAGDAKLL